MITQKLRNNGAETLYWRICFLRLKAEEIKSLLFRNKFYIQKKGENIMFKKLMSCILAFAVAFTCLSVFRLDTFKAVAAANTEPYHYFYGQLSPEAQKIYDVLYEMYKDGSLKDGTKTVDLVEKDAISAEMLEAYLSGDPTLSDCFSAAKDAFDLECPDAWYFDSSYITMRVGKKESGDYAVYMGIGRADT